MGAVCTVVGGEGPVLLNGLPEVQGMRTTLTTSCLSEEGGLIPLPTSNGGSMGFLPVTISGVSSYSVGLSRFAVPSELTAGLLGLLEERTESEGGVAYQTALEDQDGDGRPESVIVFQFNPVSEVFVSDDESCQTGREVATMARLVRMSSIESPTAELTIEEESFSALECVEPLNDDSTGPGSWTL